MTSVRRPRSSKQLPADGAARSSYVYSIEVTRCDAALLGGGLPSDISGEDCGAAGLVRLDQRADPFRDLMSCHREVGESRQPCGLLLDFFPFANESSSADPPFRPGDLSIVSDARVIGQSDAPCRPWFRPSLLAECSGRSKCRGSRRPGRGLFCGAAIEGRDQSLDEVDRSAGCRACLTLALLSIPSLSEQIIFVSGSSYHDCFDHDLRRKSGAIMAEQFGEAGVLG